MSGNNVVKSASAILLFAMLAIAPAAAELTAENLILRGSDGYLTVNHVVISETSAQEAGYQAASAGRYLYNEHLEEYYNTSCCAEKIGYIKSADPVYGSFIDGIRKAYGIEEGNSSFDYTYPISDTVNGVLCSAVCIPGELTQSGHTLTARNYDWHYAPDWKLNKQTSYSVENTILELRKDAGYDTLSITTKDMLSGILDGVNEKGLYVTILADKIGYNVPSDRLFGRNSTRMHIEQALRSILENCDSADEAEKHLLNLDETAVPKMHILVADKSGNAFAADFAPDTGKPVITKNPEGMPFIITNHALYPETRAPEYVNSSDPHNTYNRYDKLTAYTEKHAGKYSVSDCFEMMSEVQADTDSEAGNPARTFWTVVTDLETKTMYIRFLLTQGDIIGGEAPYYVHELIKSGDYVFTLSETRTYLQDIVYMNPDTGLPGLTPAVFAIEIPLGEIYGC